MNVKNRLPVVLAFDTAGAICSVALLCHRGCKVLRSDAERRHARELLPMISRLMSENGVKWPEIDALAIVRGPGSFTGLRIGSAVAQGLAFAQTLPVVTVSSLHLLAEKALAQESADFVFVCVEARTEEYYYGLFRVSDGALLLPGKEAVGDLEALVQTVDQCGITSGRVVVTGDAFNAMSLKDLASERKFVVAPQDHTVDAADLAQIAARLFIAGESHRAEEVMPVYLKDDMVYRRSDA